MYFLDSLNSYAKFFPVLKTMDLFFVVDIYYAAFWVKTGPNITGGLHSLRESLKALCEELTGL